MEILLNPLSEGTNRNMEMYSLNNKANWKNWLWHIDNAIQNGEELEKHLTLYETERFGLRKEAGTRIFITPYMVSLLEADGENGPLRKQFLPYVKKEHTLSFSNDALHEESACVVPHLLHKYRNRVALLVNSTCANYCQFCTRQRITKHSFGKHIMNDLTIALKYIKEHISINDVLVTGGDPLLLKTENLVELLDKLYQIKHIKIVRIGTRIPITLPMRIDNELVSKLNRYSPLYINIHINHVSEINKHSEQAILALANVGIPLGSQTVLLHGINDNIESLKELFERMLQVKVKPYYLYQCEEVEGCENFIVHPLKGIRLLNDLCGMISGLAIPRYVIDTRGNFSKLTLAPSFVKYINGETLCIDDGYGSTFEYSINVMED